ncbi:MAG: autotransporter domain-containing protein [Campylobacter sp.]|nr:autotransporter domain-containing protein [Campylobacter sp.]
MDSSIIDNISNIDSSVKNASFRDDNVATDTFVISFVYVDGFTSNLSRGDTDVDGVVATAGVAARSDNILVGAFFQYGYADYDEKLNSYKSDGEINAYTFRLLARFDLPSNLLC